jgi:tRNA pseudouridine38-40 synthase
MQEPEPKRQKKNIISPSSVIPEEENYRLEQLWIKNCESISSEKKSETKPSRNHDSQAQAPDQSISVKSDAEKKPKKKVALLMSYSGHGYQGMQVNPGVPTIELDLLKALALSGAVSADNAMNTDKITFVRAARTDKGVHALGQCVSFKMIIEEKDIIEKINRYLPPQIRVWDYVRTNNSVIIQLNS